VLAGGGGSRNRSISEKKEEEVFFCKEKKKLLAQSKKGRLQCKLRKRFATICGKMEGTHDSFKKKEGGALRGGERKLQGKTNSKVQWGGVSKQFAA